MKRVIKEVSLKEAFKVHKMIPEFVPNPPKTLKEFEDHIKDAESLILVVYNDGTPVGYSIGYDRFNNGSFYVWLSGVIPEYRKLGNYFALNEYQEGWAKKKGYKSIKIKTWNRRVEMRIALAKSGFNIVEFEGKPDVLDNRLMHEKIL